MHYSYNWLAKHFDTPLPSPQELGEVVGLHAFEFEGLEEVDKDGVKDTLIDWDVLPNRSSDALSYRGMVHEIAAVLDTTAREQAGFIVGSDAFSEEIQTSNFLSLNVENESSVLRATKRLAIDVKVGESPQWLKELLLSIGQKSINNVVDITNYVMWETGQPVHAFDYDKLAGAENDSVEVSIRYAKNDEKITDLTGTEHELDDSMIVIADTEKALDIAGVKGGMGSGVDENTKRVMLSVCNFNYVSVRKTARKLKLHTDASKRFENEVPIGKVEEAMQLLSRAIQDVAGAQVSAEIVDSNPVVITREKITLSVSTTNSILGTDLNKEEIVAYLARVRCDAGEGDTEFAVSVPPERLDLNFAGDLIEEVGRLYGYEKLESVMPTDGFDLPVVSPLNAAIRGISDTLVTLGFYEVKNRSIVEKGAVKLSNPLNKKRGELRDYLHIQLMERAEKNLAYSDKPKLFEIGKVWTGIEDGELQELWRFTGIIGQRKIKDKNKEAIFLEAKGALEQACSAMGVSDINFVVSEHEGLEADILNNEGKAIGHMWVNGWELDLEPLVEMIDDSVDYKRPSKYPRIDRDVAVFVPVDTIVDSVMNLIKKELPKETQEFELFDVFEKDEKKSFAFRIVFQSDTETLSDEWANGVLDNIYSILTKEDYEIR